MASSPTATETPAQRAQRHRAKERRILLSCIANLGVLANQLEVSGGSICTLSNLRVLSKALGPAQALMEKATYEVGLKAEQREGRRRSRSRERDEPPDQAAALREQAVVRRRVDEILVGRREEEAEFERNGLAMQAIAAEELRKQGHFRGR